MATFRDVIEGLTEFAKLAPEGGDSEVEFNIQQLLALPPDEKWKPENLDPQMREKLYRHGWSYDRTTDGWFIE